LHRKCEIHMKQWKQHDHICSLKQWTDTITFVCMSVTKLNSIQSDCSLFRFYIHFYFECANKCQCSMLRRYESRAPHDRNLGTTWHSASFSCQPPISIIQQQSHSGHCTQCLCWVSNPRYWSCQCLNCKNCYINQGDYFTPFVFREFKEAM
jgi:hypothetical protein